jgi:hypothetical protein
MNPRHASSLDGFHRRRLQSLETMGRGGSAIAIPAALNYCDKHGPDLPKWFIRAAAQFTNELVKKKKKAKRGRSAGPLDRYRQDMTDFARYDEVCTVREKQKEILQELERLRHLPNLTAGIIEDKERMLAWVGQSFERAFQCVSMILAETPAFGGPGAIKASYFRVKEAMLIPEQAYRYHVMDPQFLLSLEILPFELWGKVRKISPLFDLTL